MFLRQGTYLPNHVKHDKRLYKCDHKQIADPPHWIWLTKCFEGHFEVSPLWSHWRPWIGPLSPHVCVLFEMNTWQLGSSFVILFVNKPQVGGWVTYWFISYPRLRFCFVTAIFFHLAFCVVFLRCHERFMLLTIASFIEILLVYIDGIT